MAAHTDPSPAATSAAPSLPPFLTPIHPYPPSSPIPPHRPKQICLPHSNLSLYGPELAFTPAFLSSKTSPLKHKSRRERESGRQEAIRNSICLSHQPKEVEDSRATQTLCPSPNPRFEDSKRKRSRFTSLSKSKAISAAGLCFSE